MNSARRIVIDTGVLVSAAIRPDSTPTLAVEKALLLASIQRTTNFSRWLRPPKPNSFWPAILI
jgi:predicted nucleic acid-binding protein